MSQAENKADRLLKIEALLLAHPEGLNQAEIARRLGVNRSTILRNLADVPNIYQEDDGLLRIDRTAYLVNVRLNLNEALALHLATRLLATRLDRQNPHAAAALRKLGISMEKLAPRISAHMLQSADVMDDPVFQRQDPVYLAALERLTLAWSEQRMVHVWHRHDEGPLHEYDFAPYFIEPNAVGQSTYAIGLRQPPGAVRTFKIERLERVEIGHEHYELAPDFDPRAFLRSAWGIWYTEGEPVPVVLRFTGGVARRVKESRWHPSQELQDLPDGGLVWRAEIAEPREMLPWIRGWGAEVEVLEPEGLRNLLICEAQRLAQLYQVDLTKG
jgi:predicted DNA-binding transcriptional regulator YafY